MVTERDCHPTHPRITATGTEDGFGYSFRSAGDVNNDGNPDVIVGAIWGHALMGLTIDPEGKPNVDLHSLRVDFIGVKGQPPGGTVPIEKRAR